MVCDRCKMAVKKEILRMGFTPLSVELGEVEVVENLTNEALSEFEKSLENLGFKLIYDQNNKTIEKIKSVVIELIHHSNHHSPLNYSSYLENALNRDYNYLSHLFSEHEGVTLEKYIIKQKIEKVKELVSLNEVSLNEIAFEMGYSSVAYLSYQFKKSTGITITDYRKVSQNLRQPLDQI